MEARLVREELEKCQKGEGVNHYENCKWLSDKYLKMMKENRVSWVVIHGISSLRMGLILLYDAGARLQADRAIEALGLVFNITDSSKSP